MFMSKHQVLKNAIEAFQPGGADAPFLYTTTEMNQKSFQALIGRKVKGWSIHYVVAICIIIAAVSLVVTVPAILLREQAIPPAFGGIFAPLFVILYLRSTLISVTDEGLDFYFASSAFGSKYTVYDKFTLPYDRISNVRVKTGKILKNNRYLTFEFQNNGKTYKIKTSLANRMRRMQEQEGNLRYLLEVLERENIKYQP